MRWQYILRLESQRQKKEKDIINEKMENTYSTVLIYLCRSINIRQSHFQSGHPTAMCPPTRRETGAVAVGGAACLINPWSLILTLIPTLIDPHLLTDRASGAT